MKIYAYFLLVAAALASATSDGEVATYEAVVEQLFYIGNDIRNNPGDELEGFISAEDDDYLDEKGGQPNLKWSDGLSRACRDLVIENGPYGLEEGHNALKSGNEDKRAGKYTTSYDDVIEVITFDPIEFSEDVSKNRHEAKQQYAKFLDLEDEFERDALFDEDVTHVGISCGCHAQREEFCCFSYGINVVEKSGVEPKGVIEVDQSSCEKSGKWSDNVEGKSYEDDNSGVEKAEEEKPADTPDAPKEEKVEKKKESFEKLSNNLFESFERLAEDPQFWAKDVKSTWAKKAAHQFKPHKIQRSEALTQIALDFENESAPCNYDVDQSGYSLKTSFETEVDRYHSAYLVSYHGPYHSDESLVLVDLLENGRIDKSVMEGKYGEMGVACACNSEYGMECLFIFCERCKVKGSNKMSSAYMEILNKENCEKKCGLDIFAD